MFNHLLNKKKIFWVWYFAIHMSYISMQILMFYTFDSAFLKINHYTNKNNTNYAFISHYNETFNLKKMLYIAHYFYLISVYILFINNWADIYIAM